MHPKGKWFSWLTETAVPWRKPSRKSEVATPICRCCFKDIKNFSFATLFSRGEEAICPKCYLEMGPMAVDFEIDGTKATALFPYSDSFRSRLYALKGQGDIEMGAVFLSCAAAYLELRYAGYHLVPAPSHPSHDEERGYNHVEEIFSHLKLPMIKLLTKTKDVKQAGSSAVERQKIGQALAYKEGKIDLRGKKILFVDDVFTTGATARACLSLIKALHPKKVRALFLAKVEEKEEGKPIGKYE